MGNPIKIKATVEYIVEFGQDTFDVWLVPQARKPRFKAGQFMHLALDDFDPAGGFWPDSRVFSIASSPEDERLRIIYSVKGAFTGRMRQELCIGKEIWVKLPYGDFIIDDLSDNGNEVVLVAGGTGISPYLAWLGRTERNAGSATLHYGVRRNSYITPGLNLAAGVDARIYVEEEEPADLTLPGVIRQQGRLSIDAIFRPPADAKHPVYFLSGPPQMIKAFSIGLKDRGVPYDNIKIDEWE